MSDEPITLPAPLPTTIPNENWLLSVAGKKVSWALAKLIVAKGSTPAAVAIWGLISNTLKPLGITIIIDQNTLNLALPGAIFGVLVAGHDFLKVKFPHFKWL